MNDDARWASEEEVRSHFQERTFSSRTTREKIIVEAKKLDPTVERLEDALEIFYMNGTHDESSGDVDCPTGHFYRVDRWIVTTDTQGFHYVWSFNEIPEAKKEFQRLDKEYSEWQGEE